MNNMLGDPEARGLSCQGEGNQMVTSLGKCLTSLYEQHSMQNETKESGASMIPQSPRPPPFHAMPLPRLGCGGPTQVNTLETREAHHEGSLTAQTDLHGPTLTRKRIKPFPAQEGSIKFPRSSSQYDAAQGLDSGDHQLAEHRQVEGCPVPFADTIMDKVRRDEGCHAKLSSATKAKAYDITLRCGPESPQSHATATPIPRLGCGGLVQSMPGVSNERTGDQAHPVVQPHATPPWSAQEGVRTQKPASQQHPISSEVNLHCQQGCHAEVPSLLSTPANGQSQDDEVKFEQEMLQVCQKIESQSGSFLRGGVPGFSTGHPPSITACHSQPQPQPQETAISQASTQDMDAMQIHAPDQSQVKQRDPLPSDPFPSVADHPEEMAEIFLIADGTMPHAIRMPWGHTAGQLLVAHAKITQQEVSTLAINTAMSTQIPLSAVLMPGTIVRIDKVSEVCRRECQNHREGNSQVAPVLHSATREQMLWDQRGWVALDEMSFYMKMLQNSYPGVYVNPRKVHPTDHCHLTRIVLDLIQQAHQSQGLVAFVAILIDNHWFPIAAQPHQEKIALWTPKSEVTRISHSIQASVGDHPIDIFPTVFPHHFPADCGFQTVGWMISTESRS